MSPENQIIPPYPVQGEFVGKMLSGSQRKTAFALRMNAETLVRRCGLNSVGFLTLTVGDYHCKLHGKQVPSDQNFCPVCRAARSARRMHFVGVTDPVEASRRMNNLARRFLPGLFMLAIVVTERTRQGWIHFHLLGGLLSGEDIRTGLDFAAVKRRDYRSATPALRALWRVLRGALPGYGFGRHELLPVRKTGDCVAAYIAKYVEKNVCNRTAQDKHKKLVRYMGWEKTQLKANEFEWNGPQAQAWRGKARELCGLVGVDLEDVDRAVLRHVGEACAAAAGKIRPKMLDGSRATDLLGPRWAFRVSGLMALFTAAQVPFMIWTWAEMNLCRRELAREVNSRHLKGLDRQKLDHREGVADLRALLASGHTFRRVAADIEAVRVEKFASERNRLHLLPVSRRELSRIRLLQHKANFN